MALGFAPLGSRALAGQRPAPSGGTTPPTFVAKADAFGNSNTLTGPVPPGISDGDQMTWFATGETTRTIATPSGWSQPTGSPFVSGAPGWPVTYVFTKPYVTGETFLFCGDHERAKECVEYY